MAPSVDLHWDRAELQALRDAISSRVLRRAARKASSTALRDMRSEASKRVRQRKRIRAKVVRQALVLRRPPRGSKIDSLEFGVDVRGAPVPLIDYPNVRQTKKGVTVAVNRGKRTLVRSAFIARMRSGHKGVFIRRGAKRLPIRELLGSRPVDALLHDGEAEGVQRRGRISWVRAFDRLLPMELEKERRR